MGKKFKLSIEEPCVQKWESFEPRAKDRGFCGSCQMEVIDFTTMSDVEIRNHFQSLPKNVCGKLRKDQLKVYVDSSPKKGISRWVAWPIAASAALFGGHVVNAQETDSIENSINELSNLGKIELQYPRIVTGKITDAEGRAISEASISIVGSDAVLKSDSKGYYEISVPSQESFLLFESKHTLSRTESVTINSIINIVLKRLDIYELHPRLGGITACAVEINDFQKRMDQTKELIMRLFR